MKPIVSGLLEQHDLHLQPPLWVLAAFDGFLTEHLGYQIPLSVLLEKSATASAGR